MFKWLYKKGKRDFIKNFLRAANSSTTIYTDEFLNDRIMQINEFCKDYQKKESTNFKDTVHIEDRKISSFAFLLYMNLDFEKYKNEHLQLTQDAYPEGTFKDNEKIEMIINLYYDTRLTTDTLDVTGINEIILDEEDYVSVSKLLDKYPLENDWKINNIKIIKKIMSEWEENNFQYGLQYKSVQGSSWAPPPKQYQALA